MDFDSIAYVKVKTVGLLTDRNCLITDKAGKLCFSARQDFAHPQIYSKVYRESETKNPIMEIKQDGWIQFLPAFSIYKIEGSDKILVARVKTLLSFWMLKLHITNESGVVIGSLKENFSNVLLRFSLYAGRYKIGYMNIKRYSAISPSNEVEMVLEKDVIQKFNKNIMLGLGIIMNLYGCPGEVSRRIAQINLSMK